MLYYGFRNQHGLTHVVTPNNQPLGGWRVDASTNLYDWGGAYHAGTLRLASALLRHHLRVGAHDKLPCDPEQFARDKLVRQPHMGFDLDPAEIDAWLATNTGEPKPKFNPWKPKAKAKAAPAAKRRKSPKLAGRT